MNMIGPGINMQQSLIYFRYFLYLAWHWSLPLAWFIIRHEIKGEKKYNHFSCGIDDLTNSVSANDRLHASLYQPVNFYTAEKLFALLPDKYPRNVLLDAGCGKGRVIAMAAHYGFGKMIGFDISPQLCMQAIDTLSVVAKQYPGTSINIDVADAADYEMEDDVDTIFIFNPFDNHIMKPFVGAVMQSIARRQRHISVMYANPVHKQTWIDAGFMELHHFQKMQWLEGSILTWSPAKRPD